MSLNSKIRSLATDESITLYWDKPDEWLPGMEYYIFLDYKFYGTTNKTHYKISDLEPEKEYFIQIKNEKGSTNIFDEVRIKTEKRKILLDITKEPYCAVGDGETMNTQAIQQAIDDCRQDMAVYIPSGIFLTGALRLHSNMELYLEQGAILQGTHNPEDYLPRIWSRFEGIELECYSSLLNLGILDHNSGYNCRNVVIRGKGTIASGGRKLADRVIASEKENLKEYLSVLGEEILECEKPETIPGRVRPRLINMSNCQNINISGITLKNGASWNVHMIYSDHIVTNGCTFYSEGVWNGDGWDPDSSSNCTIFDCQFYTGDDAVAIKSGKNPEGNAIGRPSEHIRVFDCRSAFGHGITIGSEMSGGIDDISIWDCDMGRSLCGIEIKGTKKRGGYVRNVVVSDCVAARISFHSVAYNDDGIGAPLPPVFENCKFNRIQVLGEYLGDHGEWISCDGIELCGFEKTGHELRNIEFRNICLGRPGQKNKKTISMQCCENVSFCNIRSV